MKQEENVKVLRDDINMSPTAKLPVLDKFIWSLNGFCTGLPWVIAGYYLLYFYTDVIKMSPVTAGIIMSASRMFDAFTDLMIGFFVDRCHFRWGKYRSWIRFSIPVCIVMWVLLWTNWSGASITFNVVMQAIAYGCFGAIGCTMHFVPMNAQIATMTSNSEERTSAVSWRGITSNVATLAAALGFMPLVELFGGGNESRGFLLAALFWMIPYIGILVAVYIMSKKYELNRDGTWRASLESIRTTENAGKKTSLLTQLKLLFTNRPAVIATIGLFTVYVVQAMRNSTVVYLYNYYFELPHLTSIALFFNCGVAIVGALIMKPLVRFFRDPSRAYIFSAIACAALYALFWLLPTMLGYEWAHNAMNYGVLFWLFAACGLFQGAYFQFAYLMLPGAVDYGLWKNKVNQSGLIYSLSGFGLTFGSSVGAALLGFALDSIGYHEGVTITNSIRDGLLLVGVLIPSALGILHAVIQCFYGMSEKRHIEIMAEIQAREQAPE